MTNFNPKLLSQLRRAINNIQSSPSLSLKRQNIAYYISIAGTAVSVLLGIVSLILAVEVQRSAVKIEKMDTLINELAKQDTTNKKALNELISISSLNSLSIIKLDSILHELYKQYNIATTNTEPKINITTATPHRITDTSVYAQIIYTNSGSREALKLNIIDYALYDNKGTLTVSTVRSENENITVTPGQVFFHRIGLTNRNSNILDNLKMRIDFHFTDKFNNRPYTQSFYFKFDWNTSETGGAEILTLKNIQSNIDKTIKDYQLKNKKNR